MRRQAPTTAGEMQFVKQAEGRLPLRQAEVHRNQGGGLVYQWASPSDEVGGLWLTIYDQKDIMLSSRLSHTHVERGSTARRIPAGADVWSRMIEEAISEALEIMGGQTAFVVLFDPAGDADGSSGMSPLWMWKDRSKRAEWTEHYGNGWTARAWNWFGEVID